MSGSLNLFLICTEAIVLCFHAPLKLFVGVLLCKGSASTFSIKALLDFRTVKLDIFIPDIIANTFRGEGYLPSEEITQCSGCL